MYFTYIFIPGGSSQKVGEFITNNGSIKRYSTNPLQQLSKHKCVIYLTIFFDTVAEQGILFSNLHNIRYKNKMSMIETFVAVIVGWLIDW